MNANPHPFTTPLNPLQHPKEVSDGTWDKMYKAGARVVCLLNRGLANGTTEAGACYGMIIGKGAELAGPMGTWIVLFHRDDAVKYIANGYTALTLPGYLMRPEGQ